MHVVQSINLAAKFPRPGWAGQLAETLKFGDAVQPGVRKAQVRIPDLALTSLAESITAVSAPASRLAGGLWKTTQEPSVDGIGSAPTAGPEEESPRTNLGTLGGEGSGHITRPTS